MLFIVLNIILTVGLSFIFKIFSKKEIRQLPAIIVNYFVCGMLGIIFMVVEKSEFSVTWEFFLSSLGLSTLFISGFSLLALNIDKFGIAISSIMQKMSLVLTAMVSIYLYSEHIGMLKFLGILLGVFAIILANYRNDTSHEVNIKSNMGLWLLPALLLVSNTAVELGLQSVEKRFIHDSNRHLFNTLLFTGAGVLGFIFFFLNQTYLSSPTRFHKTELIGGIILGIPNYFSIYFLTRALSTGIEGSTLFPLINIAVILFSVLGSVLFFYEKLNRLQYFGMIIACIAIIFIRLGTKAF